MDTTSWLWLGAALLPSVLALGLLALGLRTSSREALRRLRRRVTICALLAVLGPGVGLVSAGVYVYRALYGTGVDPAARATVLAEGISQCMNCLAAGLVATPLPLLALIALALRERRSSASRQSAAND